MRCSLDADESDLIRASRALHGANPSWWYEEPKTKGAVMQGTSLANKLGLGFVVLLIGAFAVTTMPVLLSPAVADDVAAARDDDVRDVATVADDDDDDDDDSRSGRDGSDSGSRSVGSNSGNTATGTTNGTDKSKSVSNSSDRSNHTATGTTRGTGKSASVSNSS